MRCGGVAGSVSVAVFVCLGLVTGLVTGHVLHREHLEDKQGLLLQPPDGDTGQLKEAEVTGPEEGYSVRRRETNTVQCLGYGLLPLPVLEVLL